MELSMIINYEELMRWAREQAPLLGSAIRMGENYVSSRAVRLEIAIGISGMSASSASGVWARVYLRDPRCRVVSIKHLINCECGPLAEKRIA
jgi:hypothetical protein